MTENRIGKFEVLAQIGAGGMAEVFHCRERDASGRDRSVVVKRIRAERSADPDFVAMFLDEARLASRLDHANVVRVFEIGAHEGQPFIAMELVDGPTLAALVREARRRGKLHLGHVARIIADVCAGLEHAHGARGANGEPLGLVHRDVSPQNIMISRAGVPKLLDFGVAKANGRLSDTRAGTLKGRLRYMAPEQLGGTVDHRADVFSLGVCLYEATTGQSPYGPALADEVALWANVVAGRSTPPRELVTDYPPELEAIVRAAIEPDVARRCPSARALGERLAAFAATAPFRASAADVAAWVAELFPAQSAPADVRRTGARPRMSPFNPLAAVLASDTSASAVRPRTLVRGRRVPRAWLWAGAAVVTAVAAVALWPARPPSAARDITPAAASTGVPPQVLAAELAREYLEAAERLAAQEQRAPALDLLARVRGLGVQDPDLDIRVSRLTDAIEIPSLLARAGRHLAFGELSEARALADKVLERDPDNQAAAQLVAAARSSAVAAEPADKTVARARRKRVRAGLAAPRVPALPATVTVAGRPSAPVTDREAATPAALPSGRPVYSTRPRALVPPPSLPRSYRAQDAQDLTRMLALVEAEALKAGCSPEFARGITGPLGRVLARQPAPEIYPAGLYYLIVREAAVGRDKAAAEHHLASAHRSGLVKALNHLPVSERGLASR